MPNPPPLQPGQFYHIYNRGNNGETLFREERNYPHFLKLYGHYIEPVAETFAYCLLKNHFHLLVRIKNPEEWQSSEDCHSYNSLNPSRAFANLFSTYTKAFNRAYARTGSLFEKPFRRKLVESNRYFTCLVAYIHRNPQRHGFVDDFRHWPFSSYRAVTSDRPTRVQRQEVLDWFDGPAGFEQVHRSEPDEGLIAPVIMDD